MTYKTFESLIKRLLEIRRDEENLNKALKQFSPDFNYLCFSKQEDLIIDCLKAAMNDEFDYICYWLYELNAGKDAKKDSIRKGGKNIPIRTIKDLYNILCK
jgi:hypothetical protein